ncbi:hypothetical protein E1263_24775 [Kribbella antibiotica]|uniref:Uncharacterized protein n=1 Tax=Kribbella antibiotica TaxID=190195 RepID=A0A4R4ZFB0_9ACTN|nr:hypothetical protein [Kribbella antibiotica]TDD57065.1 hypothetical protein E1263_24775 [Kribbella antibiotica]
MRKLAVAVAAAAILTTGLQAPAWAAAPEAPTDFKISLEYTQLELAWKDDNAKNVVYVEREGQAPYVLTTVAATAANKFSLPGYELKESDKTRLIVKSEVDGVLSTGAVSAWFDTHRPARLVLLDANPEGPEHTKLTWKAEELPDSTPGDPLDFSYTNTTVSYTVATPGHHYIDHFPASAGYGFIRTALYPRPFEISMFAWNEWGASKRAAKAVRLGTLGARTTVPATATYASRLGIKSTIDLFTGEGREERASGIPVELQARRDAKDAWKTVGRYAGNTTTAFDTGIAALGNRQYRLFVPARKVVSTNVIALTPAASTAVKSSTTLAKFTAAGFTQPTAQVGTTVKLSVKIQPAKTVQATLQRWDGKKWLNGAKIQLTKGSALVLIKAVGRGTTSRYRVTVPAILFNDLTISATASPTFTLTVR